MRRRHARSTIAGMGASKYLAIGLVTSAVASATLAATWIPIAGPEGVGVEVDIDSLGKRGKYVKAWTRGTYPEPQSDSVRRTPWRSFKQLELLDCAEVRAATVQQVFYSSPDGGGSTVHTFSIHEDLATFKEVVPDSIAAANFRDICDLQEALKRRPKDAPARAIWRPWCVDLPSAVPNTDMYKCATKNGNMSYWTIPQR